MAVNLLLDLVGLLGLIAFVAGFGFPLIEFFLKLFVLYLKFVVVEEQGDIFFVHAFDDLDLFLDHLFVGGDELLDVFAAWAFYRLYLIFHELFTIIIYLCRLKELTTSIISTNVTRPIEHQCKLSLISVLAN